MTEIEQQWILHPLHQEPQLHAPMGQGSHHGADSNFRFLSSTDVHFTVVSVNLPVHGFQAAAKDVNITNRCARVQNLQMKTDDLDFNGNQFVLSLFYVFYIHNFLTESIYEAALIFSKNSFC